MRESQEQQRLFSWAALAQGKYPELKFMFHVPNGGSRNALEALSLKRQGVKAGVPDIYLPVPRGEFHGLWIEMKVGRSKPTERQQEYIEFLRSQRYRVEICYGFDAAVEVLKNYLEG